jgi:thymidylate kinase
MGFTIWFTGLPSAGKSTLARLLERVLTQQGQRVEVLDGDEVRQRGPVARKLRYHLIGSISLLRKTFLPYHRRLPSEGECPLSAGTGTVWRHLTISQPTFG